MIEYIILLLSNEESNAVANFILIKGSSPTNRDKFYFEEWYYAKLMRFLFIA